jgi:hypothetical protein
MFDANNLAVGSSLPGLANIIRQDIQQGFRTFLDSSSSPSSGFSPPLIPPDTFTRSSLLGL